MPDSHSKRLRDARGRADLDREYESRRMLDPALAGARRIRATARWRRLRVMKLARDPLCEDCRAHGRGEPAVQVHHVEGLAERPDLAFAWSNLASLCTRCHALREGEARRRGKAVGGTDAATRA